MCIFHLDENKALNCEIKIDSFHQVKYSKINAEYSKFYIQISFYRLFPILLNSINES